MDLGRDRLRETYARDGVVFLPRALDAKALADAQAAFDWSLAHPGPGSSRIPQATDSTFYQDLYNPDCLTGYRAMLEASPIPALVVHLHQGDAGRLVHVRSGVPEGGRSAYGGPPSSLAAGSARPTWRYSVVSGQDLAVAWNRPSIGAVGQLAVRPVAGVRARLTPRPALQRLALRAGRRHGAPAPARRTAPACPDRRVWRRPRPLGLGHRLQGGPRARRPDRLRTAPAMLHGGAATHPGQRAGQRRDPAFLRGPPRHYDARDRGKVRASRGFPRAELARVIEDAIRLPEARSAWCYAVPADSIGPGLPRAIAFRAADAGGRHG